MLTGRHHNRSRAWEDTIAYTIIIILFFLLFLPGCSPRIIEKVRTEYVYQNVYQRDTLVTKDSVYIREWLKGDTVWVEKFRDRYLYRDRWRDSIIVQRDTTVIKRTQEVRVEKPLNGWQRFRIGAFPWLFLAVIGLLAWVTKKWWLRL